MNFSSRRGCLANAAYAFLFLVLGLAYLSGSAAFAQSASISGIITDPSGAVIANAQVTLTNKTQGTPLQTKTNRTGFYSLPFVPPGTYTMTVDCVGFKQLNRTDITVNVAQTITLNERLQIGDTSQSVTVDGSGINVNTTDATVSTVVDQQFIKNMPLNGRSVQSLIALVPGVTQVGGLTGEAGEFSVNGQKADSNYFTVDGVSANVGTSIINLGQGSGYSGNTSSETLLGTTQSMVSLDALQEFRATTSSYSAEYGRMPGGQFSFETRSGTNSLHGTAFDYFRNSALDANNTFNKNALPAIPRQAEHQNDFGGTFSGPVFLPRLYDGKNKTFYFFSYEGLRLLIPVGASSRDVPDLDLRQNAPAALQPYLNAFPLPNGNELTGIDDGLALFRAAYSLPSNLDSLSVRIDHSLSDRYKVFGRYSQTTSSSKGRDPQGSNLAQVKDATNKVKTFTLGSTSAFTSKLNNDLRFNYTRNDTAASWDIDNFGGATPLSSRPDSLTTPDWWSAYFFSEYLQVASYPMLPNQGLINVVNTSNYSIGRHALKFGVDYKRLANNEKRPAYYETAFFTDKDSILKNAPNSLAVDRYYADIKPVYSNFSAFVQDEWKVSPRLNLSLGLRWDLNPAPKDADGNTPWAITSSDLPTMTLAPRGTPLWKTRYTNFAPRLGIAYQIHQHSGYDTVLRTGWGLFFDTGTSGSSGAYGSSWGYTSTQDFTGSTFPVTSAQLGSMPGPSTTLPVNQTTYAFDPNLKSPYSYQWNVAIEQGLGQQQTLTVNYVASVGRQLLSQWDYSPSVIGNPNFTSWFNYIANGSQSNYNSLQAKFQRNLSHGIQALASYTWSHAMDNIATNATTGANKAGDADIDLRNNFQAAVTYEPKLYLGNRFLNHTLNDWGLDLRLSARSGMPINVVTGDASYDPASGVFINFSPDRVSGDPLYVSADVPGGRAINFNAFKIARDADGNEIDGNVKRNVARGFDAVQADLAMRRTFHVTDRVNVLFRAEAFNLLNHPIYGDIWPWLFLGPPPASGYASSGGLYFGVTRQTLNDTLGGLNSLYQTGGPRSLQLALKFQF